MHTGTNFPAYPGMALWSQVRGPARNRPCSRACMQTGADAASHAGMEPPAKTAVRKARCPLGFSEMQIAILSLLKAQPALIAYWQIAEAIVRVYGIGATEGAVRGALERRAGAVFLSAAGSPQAGRKATAMRFRLTRARTSRRHALRNRAWRRPRNRTRLPT